MPVAVVELLDVGTVGVEHDRDNEREQTQRFHKCGDDDGINQQFGCHFWLASHAFQGSRAGDADSDTRSDDAYGSDTRSDEGTSLDERVCVNRHCCCLRDECVVHSRSPIHYEKFDTLKPGKFFPLTAFFRTCNANRGGLTKQLNYIKRAFSILPLSGQSSQLIAKTCFKFRLVVRNGQPDIDSGEQGKHECLNYPDEKFEAHHASRQ